ncbi:DUF397 domain-containing protein [Streptomyces sp. NPDC058595]|uniref:DUF397 domain-containing protein n=1 Tax=Streptomyces sp. NPDC058595 TaxID=3346550 RepID=UPI00364A7D66
MRSVRPDLTQAAWRKSSYSNSDGGQCVEVSDGFLPGVVPVRDSKVPGGPALVFPARAWQAFVQTLR